MWETMWRFLKKLEKELPYDPAVHGNISKIIQSRILKRCLHTHVHWNIIHNNQVICPLLEEGKKKIWYTNKGMLHRHRKGGGPAICYNIDEAQGLLC